MPERIFEIDERLSGLSARYSIDERKVYLSSDLLDGFLGAMKKLRDNVALSIDDERLLRTYGMRLFTDRHLCIAYSLGEDEL